MSKGFEHARRFYGHPDKQDRYEICLKCIIKDPINGKYDFEVEVYDRTRKPGKQRINAYGLTHEFYDIANRMSCFTLSHQGLVEWLVYDPTKDNHWKS